MRRFVAASLAAVLVGALGPAARAGAPVEAAAAGTNFELVGHEPLYARGMNAAPAIFDHFVYIGSRTDGQAHHPHAGVLVVDVADPAKPKVVGEIGPPDEGNIGETSRELRVWPEQKLLMVLTFTCSSLIHACASSPVGVGAISVKRIRFYDLADPVAPKPVSTYTPTYTPHEFFLWVDPARPGRALLFMSTPTSGTNRPNLVVTDISRAREGKFIEVASIIVNDKFSAEDREKYDVRLHSIGVSNDGTRTYLAYLGAGFLVVDSSDVAKALPKPQLRLITAPAGRAGWGNPGAHSAVKVFGRALALVTDEVYGDLLDPISGDDHGCPWGWVRMIDIADEAHPKVVGQYKIEQNLQAYCSSPDGQDPLNTYFTSYSAHNPTVLRDLAFVTWHSGGLQVISIADPARPVQVGAFLPQPLDQVATDDPALSLGRNKVVMWSYPIIKDGLIYVVDIRNGLYVLRYKGPGAREVSRIGFLEGNSNLGDALLLEPPTAVAGVKVTRPVAGQGTKPAPKPRPSEPLPATGTGAPGWAAVGLLGAAAALAVRRALRAG